MDVKIFSIEMLFLKVVLNLVIVWFVNAKSSGDDGFPVNEKLITSLRNDANLDLSVDEEYEDLRAELLAYHTALATLSDSATRRSMKSTTCWNLGGICINYKLCEGYRYITEVPGCKDKLTVCCFAWNKFHVRDWSDYGLHNIALPWRHPQKIGGEGVISVEPEEEKPKAKKSKKKKSKAKISEKKKPKKLKLQKDSLEVKTQKEPGLRNLDIYNIALPWKDLGELGGIKVVEIKPEVPQVRRKQLMAKDRYARK